MRCPKPLCEIFAALVLLWLVAILGNWAIHVMVANGISFNAVLR